MKSISNVPIVSEAAVALERDGSSTAPQHLIREVRAIVLGTNFSECP